MRSRRNTYWLPSLRLCCRDPYATSHEAWSLVAITLNRLVSIATWDHWRLAEATDFPTYKWVPSPIRFGYVYANLQFSGYGYVGTHVAVNEILGKRIDIPREVVCNRLDEENTRDRCEMQGPCLDKAADLNHSSPLARPWVGYQVGPHFITYIPIPRGHGWSNLIVFHVYEHINW